VSRKLESWSVCEALAGPLKMASLGIGKPRAVLSLIPNNCMILRKCDANALVTKAEFQLAFLKKSWIRAMAKSATQSFSTHSLQRPRVFVGSSKEGLEIANVIQFLLDEDCDVDLWNRDVFDLSRGTLETLVSKASSYDFAVLILTPDDLTEKRDEAALTARDNVILELGLFIGAIGRERTFVVSERSVRLPSDLAGVTIVPFGIRPDRSLTSVLGPKCHVLRATIKTLGCRGIRDGNTSQERLLSEVGSLVAEGKEAIQEVLRLGVRTRYAGQFPECFETIATLINDATSTIRIVCDFPCYGAFSKPKLYDRYEAILRQKIQEGVEVSIVYPNREKRLELQRLQFGHTDADWELFLKDPGFMSSIERLKRTEGIVLDSIDAVHNYLLDSVDVQFQSKPMFRQRITEIDVIPALFAWVTEDRALFTIPMFGKYADEQGFYSSEERVVDVLNSVWEHYRNMGPSARPR
jgi:predicted nucleotide-binding protein